MPKVHSNFSVPLSELKTVEEESATTSSVPRPDSSFRPCCIKCGVFPSQDGSGYAEFGNTRVLAQIYGPNSDEKWEENKAKITVSIKGVSDEEQPQMRAQLASALTAVILAEKYPGKTIEIEVTVLCDDGGVLAVSLLAASLALTHSGIEALGVMTAVHVGVTGGGGVVTDPSSIEFVERQLVGGLTFCFVPNLNQVTCVDVYGRVPHTRLPTLLTESRERALALLPLVRKAVALSVRQTAPETSQ